MNDAEINYLADMYLACFKLDRSERAYRRFKNAVILTSDGSVTFRDACRAIGEIEQKSENAVSSAIIRALKNLPAPADEIFNATYSRSAADCVQSLIMPPYKDAADIVMFLGTAFLYLRLVNYNKFDLN